MGSTFIHVARVTVVFVLAASSTSCTPQIPIYAPPSSLTTQSGATVVGSEIKTSIWENNVILYPMEVDNVATNINYNYGSWKTRLLVAPGPHTFKIGICQCGLALVTQYGNTVISANLEAGKTYILAGTKPSVGYMVWTGQGNVWLQDSDGKRVSTTATENLQSPPQEFVLPH